MPSKMASLVEDNGKDLLADLDNVQSADKLDDMLLGDGDGDFEADNLDGE